jgi:cysteine desulfuration protein SufE
MRSSLITLLKGMLLLTTMAVVTQGFLVRAPPSSSSQQRSIFSSSSSSRKGALAMSSTDIDESSLGLTPRLLEVSRAFQLMDDRTRVQQLLALAGSLKPFKDFRRTTENKVPGCLSTVYVHAYLQDGKVYFEGDSDAQLTKGLVALLIDGMSGCAAHEIQNVKPEFIKFAGIAASLTPG